MEDQKLQRRIVAKSLDVPYGALDEMRDIQVNRGLSGVGIAALSAALLVGGGGLGVGLWSLLSSGKPAATEPAKDPPTKVIEKSDWKLGEHEIVPP